MARNKNTRNTAKPEAKVSEVIEETTNEEAVETPMEEVKAEEVKPTPPPASKPAAAVEISPVLKAGLVSYVKSMMPSVPVDFEEGARHQKKLRGLIISSMMEPDEKKAVANIQYILDFIHNDKTDTFNIRWLFRFYDVTAWNTKTERREIESLLALFEATADPQRRAKECRKIDFSSLQRLIDPTRSEIIMRRLRIAYNLV